MYIICVCYIEVYLYYNKSFLSISAVVRVMFVHLQYKMIINICFFIRIKCAIFTGHELTANIGLDDGGPICCTCVYRYETIVVVVVVIASLYQSNATLGILLSYKSTTSYTVTLTSYNIRRMYTIYRDVISAFGKEW